VTTIAGLELVSSGCALACALADTTSVVQAAKSDIKCFLVMRVPPVAPAKL
jgi:hypothetical protein